MSVCGHCGLVLEPGAAACGSCGAAVAPAQTAGERPKWGTLQITRARAGSGPLDATPRPDGAPPTAAGDPRQAKVDAAQPAASAPKLHSRPTTGQVPRPVRGASRPLSGPLTPEAAAARHPATRGHPRAPSGPLAGHGPAASAAAQLRGRPQSRPLSGPLAIQLPPTAAGEPANANHLDTGMLDLALDDRFSGSMQDGPALEMESLSPSRHDEPVKATRPQPRPQQQQQPPPAQPKPEPARDLPAEQRQRRLRDLARYPPAPHSLLATIGYCLRVYSRRRELEAQVLNLTHQRKRLELAHEDATCALGQALFGHRSHPSLQPFAAQLRVVAETVQDVGAKAAARKRTEHESKHELAALDDELAAARARAEPVSARELTLNASVESHKSQIRRLEMRVRKTDAELKALRAAPSPGAHERIATLETERSEHHGETQTLALRLLPLEEDLNAVRASVAEHAAVLEELEARKRRLLSTMGREQGRERVASGGMNAAYRDALRSLANAAIHAGLAELAPDEHKAALEAGDRAGAHRESEELMRAAGSCYEPRAYERGLQLLVGCVVGTFLLFAALILF